MTTDSNPHLNPHRRHDQDVQGRADSNVTREFWGDGADWASQPTDTAESSETEVATPRRGIGGTVGRWWSSTGRSGATRTHTAVTSSASPDKTDDVITSADDRDDPDTDWDDAWDDAWETAPPEPPRSGVDPLLARLGGLAVILTLLVPVVMGFTSDDGEAVRTSSVALDVSETASGDQPAGQPVVAASAPVAETPLASDATPAVADATVAAVPTTTVTETPITAPLVEKLDVCAVEYQIAVGDFWIRIADGSGAALADVLAVNDATVSTPLYPGRSICLPDGATIPSPPPATAVATSTASTASSSSTSSSSVSSSGTRSTGANAATTPAATTPPPPPTATQAEVEAIIRAVWPDELEARALEIAWRESNNNPTAKNSCCYGLFQVYWSVHRSWLSGLGITSADQLYDPATNARAALALYERAGSWAPWGG